MDEQNVNGDSKTQGRYQVLGEFIGKARLEAIDAFIDFAATHAKKRQFTDERTDEMARVLKEALANIITYTFGGEPGEISLSCNLDKFGKFVLAIVDSGKPFNMLLEDDPFIGALDARSDASGPTTKIIKRFSSNIEYKRLENKNHLIITLARDMKRGRE